MEILLIKPTDTAEFLSVWLLIPKVEIDILERHLRSRLGCVRWVVSRGCLTYAANRYFHCVFIFDRYRFGY